MSQKYIAFYLPQFHPIPENDVWWGKGFTEWTNVASAKPRFLGHYQPQIPADLGFYDLRLPEARASQADLAKKYGVDAFCYYHYWFNGKLLLEQPLNDVIKSGKPDLPFCICWANENWTRAWDGMEREVLIKQDYSLDDALDHIRYLVRIISDDRYYKVGEKPLILIYRPDVIPNLEQMILLWRKECAISFPGGIYIAGVKNGFTTMTDREIIKKGFDAIVDFQPNKKDFPASSSFSSVIKWVAEKILPSEIYQSIKTRITAINRIDYSKLVYLALQKKWPTEYTKFPCVFPSWDNSARRSSPTIIQNNDFSLFEKWLSHSVNNVSSYKPEENIVFINAWNEWAEGCHLEPDRRNSHGFLQAVKNTKLERKS